MTDGAREIVSSRVIDAPRERVFEAEAGKTRLVWRMQFKTAEEFEKIREYAPQANEQNLDKLEAQLNSAYKGR